MFRIKHFNTLRVRIVSNTKRSRDFVGIFSTIQMENDIKSFPKLFRVKEMNDIHLHHLLLGIFKTVRYKINWLIFRDWILLFSCFRRIEFPELWLIGQTVFKFAKGA